MSYPDAYDELCDQALQGKRVAPLFLVMITQPNELELWRVVTTDNIGDPTGTHSKHATLADAICECVRMNALYGPTSLKREVENHPLTFTDIVLAKVDELMKPKPPVVQITTADEDSCHCDIPNAGLSLPDSGRCMSCGGLV